MQVPAPTKDPNVMNGDGTYIKQEHSVDNLMSDTDTMQGFVPSNLETESLSQPLSHTTSSQSYNPSGPDLRPNDLDDLGISKYNNMYQYDFTGDTLSAGPYAPLNNSYSAAPMVDPMMNNSVFYDVELGGGSRSNYPLNQSLESSNPGLSEPVFNTRSSSERMPRVKTEDSDSMADPAAQPDDDEAESSQLKQDKKPRAKSAHNVIEQRYRNKMNEKFQVLRDSVPVLREYNRSSHGGNEDEYGNEELGQYGDEHGGAGEPGIAPVKKLNKGIILTKSIEYIKYLETKNQRKMMEYQQLLERAEMLGYNVKRD